MENEEYLFLVHSLFFLGILGFTILTNSILLRFVQTLGIREKQTLVRWSSVSKPSIGGITFFISFLITLASYSFFIDDPHAFHNKELVALVIVSILGFLMGLADDAYNTKPLIKSGVQILCGIILILSGNYIHTTPWEWLNYLLTVLWVVGIMNSINMLDNMDAITATVSSGILFTFGVILFFSGALGSLEFLLLIGVLASVIGFLFHNWHPSKMFMGDTGSQFLGVFLAYFGIKCLWNAIDFAGELIQAKQIMLVLISFALPITDTSTVFINRILRGQSPFVGGKDHTTHHLSYLGLSDSQVAMVFGVVNLINVILVIIIVRLINEWNHFYTIAFSLYFLIVFSSLYCVTRIKKKEKNEQQVKMDI